jgi:hypothetical protein
LRACEGARPGGHWLSSTLPVKADPHFLSVFAAPEERAKT